ncbi:hypothetical protein SAMN05216174_106139 [Actinokineospora iranica]|uniref:Uncharacterized protein n=1 Tax=Actinokineospora iranica TaxID=1271860 RepID=A0A1G6R593_9PSEU|nr:hypothetical protein SAMN05216174_106139 [Actinokineospora iranica]
MTRLLTNVKFWLLAVIVTWITVVTVIIAETPAT